MCISSFCKSAKSTRLVSHHHHHHQQIRIDARFSVADITTSRQYRTKSVCPSTIQRKSAVYYSPVPHSSHSTQTTEKLLDKKTLEVNRHYAARAKVVERPADPSPHFRTARPPHLTLTHTRAKTPGESDCAGVALPCLHLHYRIPLLATARSDLVSSSPPQLSIVNFHLAQLLLHHHTASSILPPSFAPRRITRSPVVTGFTSVLAPSDTSIPQQYSSRRRRD